MYVTWDYTHPAVTTSTGSRLLGAVTSPQGRDTGEEYRIGISQDG